MTILPRALVEVERVTKLVVVKFTGLLESPVLIEPANEGLPLRTGHDLRPLADLLPSAAPPRIVVLDGPHPLPPHRSDGRGSLRAEARDPRTAAALREH